MNGHLIYDIKNNKWTITQGNSHYDIHPDSFNLVNEKNKFKLIQVEFEIQILDYKWI